MGINEEILGIEFYELMNKLNLIPEVQAQYTILNYNEGTVTLKFKDSYDQYCTLQIRFKDYNNVIATMKELFKDSLS